MPSVAYTAGGLVHCYRTYLGKIENLETLEFARGETDNE